MKRIVIFLVALVAAMPLAAQRYPERSIIRSGNRQYEAGKFPEAELSYRRALETTPGSYEAQDNLAKALYKQKQWEEAEKMFAPLAADSLHRDHAAEAYYDQGNALFQQRKFAEAAEAYKQSLRINPSDQQAKFNLAYALKMLNNNQGGGGGGQNNQNQNQNQNQNNQDQKPQQAKPQPGDGKPQEGEAKQGNLSKEEAERLLQAVQMSEDKAREKEGEKKPGGGDPPAGKNW